MFRFPGDPQEEGGRVPPQPVMQFGRVRESFRSRRGVESAHFTWRIKGWRQWRRDRIISPYFSFAGTDWYMDVYFRTGSTDAYICRHQASQETVRCWLRVRRADGGEEKFGYRTADPADMFPLSWTLPDLEKYEARLAPSGTFTLLVWMSTRQQTETNLSSVHKEATELQKQQDSALFELQEAKDEIELLTQERRVINGILNDVTDLQEHLKKLLLSADDYDVLLKVQTAEFRAHKIVLRARSPVFEAMFKHGMKESAENKVDIEDCDPKCFGQFLEYVYTGEVEDLSPSDAPGLYYIGDKYGLPVLKRRCVDLLQSSLSASLVCDVITLAVTHGEEDLLQTAMDYVSQHLADIMETVEWQRFAMRNPIQASELQANEICLKVGKRRESSDSRGNEFARESDDSRANEFVKKAFDLCSVIKTTLLLGASRTRSIFI